MRKTFLSVGIVLFILLSARVIFAAQDTTSTPSASALKSSIQEKAQELNDLNKKILEVDASLSQTKTKSQGLSQDISRLDSNISRLNLKVRAGELTVDKLRLELQDLDIGITNAEASIQSKKEAVAASLRIVQQKDADNLLVILLRNRSLSESASEAQNIFNFNNSLSAAISDLKSLQDDLSGKLSATSEKKQVIEHETQNTKYQQSLSEEQKKEKDQLLSFTKAEQQNYESKKTELEKQQEEISRTIDDLEQKLRASFDPSLLPLKRPGVFAYPVSDPVITQEYGATDFAESAYKNKLHTGIDFRASIGTEIYAADDGIILASDYNDKGTLKWQKYQYGRYILIQHQNNLATLYAHLSTNLVRKGEQVKRGELIGYSGNTGYATGPHLHFGVYWAPSIQLKSIPPAAGLVPIGVTVNPRDYL